MFPEFLCSRIPMFPGALVFPGPLGWSLRPCVPGALCSRSSVFPDPYVPGALVFPCPDVPGALCSRIPTFQELLCSRIPMFPELLSSQVRMFLERCVPGSRCSCPPAMTAVDWALKANYLSIPMFPARCSRSSGVPGSLCSRNV